MAMPAEKNLVYMLNATRISLYFNIVLVLIKIASLCLVNSLAIAVDLGISCVGLAISIILFYSIQLANKPADLLHNYGYGKIENVCETIEGIILIGIAFTVVSQAVLGVLHPKSVQLPWVGFVSSAINMFINFGGAFYILLMARKSGSPAIRAEGLHWQLEGFISGVIAASFMVSMYVRSKGYGNVSMYIDPAAAVIVSLMIVFPSFDLAKKSFFKLLDASMEEDSQMEIIKPLSRHIEKYCEFKDIKTRTAGRKRFVELKIVVPEAMTVKKGQEIVDTIKNDMNSAISECEISILLESCKSNCRFVRDGQKCPYMS